MVYFGFFELFLSSCILFSLHMQVYLGLICPRISFNNSGGFFMGGGGLIICKSNLVFLFLNVTSSLKLVVNSLYLQSWRRHLLIVSFNNNTPTLSKDFYTSVCEAVFLHQQKYSAIVCFRYILLSSGCLMLSSSIYSFFSKNVAHH